MYTSAPRIPTEFILPININGLRGRMLRLPPKKPGQREVLMVYGHHASIERYYSLAQVVNDYGGVTMPDLPGFGGMDSFYKIHEKPDLDTMADYLASVVKLRYKNRRFSIAAISYGFLVATRMLQRYPEIAKKVDLVFSLAGFSHYQDFIIPKGRQLFYKHGAGFFKHRLPAAFFRNVVLHPAIIRAVYHKTPNAQYKYKGYSQDEQKAMTEFEVVLWRSNEVRTYMTTGIAMLTVDNCRTGQVAVPVHHISINGDNYFDNNLVEQHMRVIYSDYINHVAKLDRHVPNILAEKQEAADMIPASVRKLLKN